MQYVRLFLLFILVFNALLLVAGLVRPTFAVWWEDTQNRRRVLKIYGSAALGLIALYLLLGYFH